MQEMEDTSRNWEDATAKAMQEVRQDITRLDSNAETQKKYFGQKLELVRTQAESAAEKAEAAQQQIDSVREQTQHMRDTLVAIHVHSEKLTTGLGNVMDRFERLHFDLPNVLDDWMRLRLGHESGRPTVSGAELHTAPWSSNGERIFVPPNPPLHPSTSQPCPPADDSKPSSSTPPPPPLSETQSDTPSKYYKELMQSQTDALRDLESEMERREHRSRSMGSRSGESASQPSPVVRSAPLQSIQKSPEAENKQDREKEAIGSQGNGGTTDVEMEMEENIPGSMEAGVNDGGVEDSRDGLAEIGVGESRLSTQANDDMDIEMEETPGRTEGNRIDQGENAMPTMVEATSLDRPSPFNDPLPTAFQTTVIPPTPSTPVGQPSSSPAVICPETVEAPPGLLAITPSVSPQSSQSTIPSPSPHPNNQLLQVRPPPTVHSGPVTRSRSRSRSTSAHPDGNIHHPSLIQKSKPSQGGKSGSRRG
jgi:hypothetical protein